MPRSVAAAIAALLLSQSASAAIRYVNAAAIGANDGTSWTHAFTDLQSAMAVATAGDEIWVARGIYKPTSGTDRTVRFILSPNVALRGGFVGTESDISQRPIDRDPVNASPAQDTIFSGDIGAAGFSDNSNRILELNAPGGQSLVERIVITGAEFASTSDGALLLNSNVSGTPVIRDTLIITNRGGRGAGVNINSARATFENCNFIDNINTNDFGGAVNAFASPQLTFSYCLFQQNSATVGGGGAVNVGGTAVTFTGCSFFSNSALGEGGAVRVSDFTTPSTASFTDCFFNSNTSLGTNTGGAVLVRNSAGSFTNCYLSQNTAAQGGAIGGQDAGSLAVDSCTFFDNTANFGGALFPNNLTTTIANSLFNANQAGTGGALMNSFGLSIEIEDTDFIANHATTGEGGALYNFGDAITARGCLFQSNSTTTGGGALYTGSGTPRFLNCRFIANTSLGSGAAAIVQGGVPLFAGCLFRNNTAAAFGAAYSATGPNAGGSIINCTIINNTSSFVGSAIRNVGPLTIANSIIRDNAAASQIDGSNYTINYCNTTQAVTGVGNINADPLFSAPGLNQFSILSGSPCIDAGDTAALPADLLEDLVGNPRRADDPATTDTGAGSTPRVDIGAFEFTPPTGCPGDANKDNITNGADLSVLLAQFGTSVAPGSGADFNNDGFVNGADLSVLLSNFGNSCG